MTRKYMSVKRLTTIGIMAALMCVISPWSIQIGPIPVTFATLALYFISFFVGEKIGVVAVLIYILLGAVGLPVFSGFTGGLQRIMGITGGYIVGYIPCVYVSGLMIRRMPKKLGVYILAMTTGTCILYLTGILWYVFQTEMSVTAAMMICVVPFVPADILKIVIASVFVQEVNKRKVL
ncbi:MAG: biotin transporter BioY [Lachnospiraceae bacterium]|nr:biotin transporter BioY [Lachnospiraceae bacterium]